MSAWAEFWEALQMGFMQRALLAGTCVAVACACFGVLVVLQRKAMIGDGLAHVSFAGVGLGLVLGAAPMWVAAAVSVAAALAVLKLPEKVALPGDTAIGMVSALGLAGGAALAGCGTGLNVDLLGYLFGDILTVTRGEVWWAVGGAVAVTGLVVAFRREWFALAYGGEEARVEGVRTGVFLRVMSVTVGLTVALGVRVVGTLLVSGLLIFPAATALQTGRSFRGVLLRAAATGAGSVAGGILAAYWLDLPAGATIILLNGVLFGLAALAGRRRRG